ncbi:MAG TPA: porin family protein [Cyclobacteriaceae bacterium]|nr:porin family protein [Cyclobacteriaceae bacterium]
MKKLFTLSALLLIITVTASRAQQSHVGILLNTVSSNLNYGDMNGSLSGYKETVRGIRAGLSWQAGITKNFSVVTEAYFVRKGGGLENGNPLNGLHSAIKLNTIELPVLARVHAGRFYFNAGPYANYIFSGKRTSDAEQSKSISFGQGPDDLRRWEAGFQGGVGYMFNLKKKRMAIDVRYAHGMTSISSTSDLYNRTFSISVVLLKPLKGRGQ